MNRCFARFATAVATTSAVTATLALTAGSATAATATAHAHADGPTVEPVASGFAGPLQLDARRNGTVFVAQTFAGVITKISADGTRTDVVQEQGSVSGLAVRHGQIAYTYNGPDGDLTRELRLRRADGSTRTITDLRAFEVATNPDRRKTYGFLNLTDECASEVPPEVGGGTPYQGVVDSNPYAVANAPGGGWYVADAGGNDVVKVAPDGTTTVVYVARRQKTVITADAAQANGLPACTVGSTYAFEGVPTDVEVASSGKLFVSLLPGGPEDPSLGARGRVVKVDPVTGRGRSFAKGFLGATNVALARHRVYVAELFGGKISVVDRRTGRVSTFVEQPTPAAVEYAAGSVVAGVDVFGQGSVVRITP